ncbi:MAG: gliding motility-associated C-terminal domain-containing protein [Chitinophagales bacterium]|nr:gliding motility-associated C-terminal domain-containing protein [Chitinophagales bacterium]
MKKLYSLFLCAIFTNLIFGQLVNYEVEIIAVERTNYSDCGGCGAPDPTWIIDLDDNASTTIDNVGIHVPANGTVYTPVNYSLSNRVNSSATNFVLALDAWEDNCNNDVFNFNTYNFFTCFPSVFGDSRRCQSSNVASVNFRTFAPCVWHNGTANFCGDYRFTYRFRWSFNQAPVIATQPSPANNNLCLGQTVNFSVAPALDPNGWPLGTNYQWQVSTITDCASATAASWTNVGGATNANFTPPQTPGTRLYRVLVTSNCTSNFSSNTTASNCVRVTYNPYGVPGDLAPAIQSGICGSVVLPGSTHNLSTLLPPAVGAANGVSYVWSTTGGSFSQTTGTSTVWTAPTTAGNYILTLTYVDACSNADAFTTCVVDVGSPNCDFAYVATTGTDDVFAGGPDNPYRTLAYAISQLAGRKYIRMAGGTYNESSVIQLQNDLVIEGGYQFSAGIWTKTSVQQTNLVLSGFQNSTVTGNASAEHRVGIYGNNDDRFTLQDLNISTTAITGTTSNNRGRSNYAILLINGCENYNIVRCTIVSGNASRGANGTTPGTAGGPSGGSGAGQGGVGANGSGNPGGGSSGSGGQTAAYNASIHPSYVFPAGANGSGGAGGAGTDNCPGGPGCGFFGPSDSGCDGAAGSNGNPGANGRSWQANDRPVVAIANSPYYIPGAQAGSGQDGGGGGQAAGGNGSRGGQSSPLCIDCDGRTGGIGGNGGQAGRGGSGGYGSGGSFGIYTNNSSLGANITNVNINVPAAVAQGGTGANGSSGVNGSGGSSGSCNGCVLPGTRCSGSGGTGARGGDGGRGRDGSNGENAHLVVDGVSSNPSTSIPSFPIVSIEYNNAKACIYSEINLTKDGPNSWNINLPFVKDLSDSPAPLVTSSFSNGSPEVQVFSTTPGQIVNLQVGGSTYNGYLRIADDVRALPVLTVSPSNTACIGTTVDLSASSWGTEVEYDWRIYQGTDVDNPSLSPSTLAAPSFNLTGLSPGLYTVRYRVREICCGWSIPVYDTIKIVDKPIVYQVQGGGGYCTGSLGATVSLSGSQNGVVYELLLNGAPVDTVIGNGAPFDFDPQLTPGNYTVLASSLLACERLMQGSVNIFVYPQPNDQDVLGDPYICNAGANTTTLISLDDSEIGVNYQLILNDTVPLGVPISGTGFGVSFGAQQQAGQYTVLATNNASSCTRYLSDTLNILLLNGPAPFNALGGGSFCAGTAGVEIELSSSAANVAYQLFWNYTVPIGQAILGTGSSLSFGSHSLEGEYTIIATDDLGCESTMQDTLNVNELNPPTFQTVIVDALDCFGDSSASITVTATSYNGNLSYILNADTNTTGVFNNLAAGNYLLSIEDDSLCSNIYPVTPIAIAEPAPLVIGLEAINDVLCFGQNQGGIGVNVNGGTPLYSYSWTSSNLAFSSSNEDISNLAGGDYYLSVSDQKGCSAADTFTVNAPTAALSGVITTVDLLCNGSNSGEASITASGGTAPYTYLWHTNDTAQTIVGLSPGNVSVTIKDANNCSTYVSSAVAGPSTPISITLIRKSNVSCFGGNNGEILISVSGGTAPYDILWSPNGASTTSLDSLEAGIYTVTVSDANLCTAVASYTITEAPEIQTSIAPTQPGCPGEETGLAAIGVNGGTAPYSYVWNTTPAQFGIVATQLSGDRWYTVSVTDFNLCVKVDSVFIQNPDTMIVNVLPGNTSCISGNDGYAYIEVVGGTAPFSYELNGNYQTDSAYTGLTPGSYYIFVEDNKGCVASSQFSITPTTSLDATLYASSLTDFNQVDEILVVSGEPIDLRVDLANTNSTTEVIAYNWSPLANLDITNCLIDSLCDNPSANPTSSMQVVVEVIELVNGVGCSTFDTINIEVRTDYPVFFPTAFSPFSDEFKTDCLNDYFEMNLAGAENLDVKIFNRWGELVFSNPNQTNGPSDPNNLDCSNPRNAWDGTFNGEPVPMGAYVYQVIATYFDGRVESFSGTVTVLR